MGVKFGANQPSYVAPPFFEWSQVISKLKTEPFFKSFVISVKSIIPTFTILLPDDLVGIS